MKWRDKSDVLTISSEFPHAMIDVEKNRSMLKKPISVFKYNEHMSGIDRQDQMTSYYPFERKTLRWYKKNRYTLYTFVVGKFLFFAQ